MPGWLKVAIKIVIPLVGLFVSAIAVWIATLRGANIDPIDQLLLVVCGVILTALFELIVISAERTYRQDKDMKAWSITHRGDVELQNIKANFPRVVQHSYSAKADLYVEYFIRRFGDLAREINQAADSGVLRVTQAHAMSIGEVLAAFADDAEKTLRYVWKLEPGEHPFGDDAIWKTYFQRTVKMTAKKTLKGIRALFVVDSKSAQKDVEILKLFAFFKHTKRLDCRILSDQTYNQVCSEYSVPRKFRDFGIYGKLLYCGESDGPQIAGEYTKDTKTIAQYKALFDSLWEGPDAERNPSVALSAVSIDELLHERSLPPPADASSEGKGD